MNKIKYAIADDHKIFRRGIIAALADTPQLNLVLEAENGKDLLQCLSKNKADVILLDLKMPEMDGIETAKEIRKTNEEVKIIVISMYDEDKYVINLMEIGANGYLLKNAEPEEIKTAIFTAYESCYYFNDFVNKALLKKIMHKAQIKPIFNKDVELTSRGTKLLEKIGVKNTAGLVMYAVKN